MRPEDHKIVEYARELCQQLRTSRLDPRNVAWFDRMPPSHIIIHHGNIMLPQRLMTRLTPEEWRPLLASSIIYNTKKRTMLQFMKSFLLPQAAGTLGLIAVVVVLLRTPGPALFAGISATLVVWTASLSVDNGSLLP